MQAASSAAIASISFIPAGLGKLRQVMKIGPDGERPPGGNERCKSSFQTVNIDGTHLKSITYKSLMGVIPDRASLHAHIHENLVDLLPVRQPVQSLTAFVYYRNLNHVVLSSYQTYDFYIDYMNGEMVKRGAT